MCQLTLFSKISRTVVDAPQTISAIVDIAPIRSAKVEATGSIATAMATAKMDTSAANLKAGHSHRCVSLSFLRTLFAQVIISAPTLRTAGTVPHLTFNKAFNAACLFTLSQQELPLGGTKRTRVLHQHTKTTR